MAIPHPYDPVYYNLPSVPPLEFSGYDDPNAINTLFVSGLPDDIKAREIHNLFRRRPGFDYCQLKYTGRGNQVVAFATFVNHPSAIASLHALNGVKFDPQTESTLHIELARSNSIRNNKPGPEAYIVIDNRSTATKDDQESSNDGVSENEEASEPDTKSDDDTSVDPENSGAEENEQAENTGTGSCSSSSKSMDVSDCGSRTKRASKVKHMEFMIKMLKEHMEVTKKRLELRRKQDERDKKLVDQKLLLIWFKILEMKEDGFVGGDIELLKKAKARARAGIKNLL